MCSLLSDFFVRIIYQTWGVNHQYLLLLYILNRNYGKQTTKLECINTTRKYIHESGPTSATRRSGTVWLGAVCLFYHQLSWRCPCYMNTNHEWADRLISVCDVWHQGRSGYEWFAHGIHLSDGCFTLRTTLKLTNSCCFTYGDTSQPSNLTATNFNCARIAILINYPYTGRVFEELHAVGWGFTFLEERLRSVFF